jgi:endonuclease-3
MNTETAERALWVLDRLAEVIPTPETELNYSSPFELIVAVVLSAQCTDKRVNQTTPALFAAYPTPQALAAATPQDVLPYIRSISYPNNKAKHLVGLAQALVERHGGQVPQDPKALEALPGVGRKTANVVGAVLWDSAVIPVDTHVFRVARRLGLSAGKTPRAVERDLMEVIPPQRRAIQHHLFILHGRRTCHARRPLCSGCVLAPRCPSAGQQGAQ